MSWSVGLQVGGISLQAIGLVLADSGFLQTYRDHDSEGLSFWAFYTAPAVQRARRVRQRSAGIMRRLLRRPQHVHVAAGSAKLTLGGSIRARARVGFGPLDMSDLQAALRELERRINDVNQRAGRDGGRLEDAIEEQKEAHSQLIARLEAAMEEMRERDRRVATSGIRPAVSGLLLSAFGLLLITAGVIVG